MKKADNIFVRAKAYVREHPRTSFQDAIQKVKGKKVSGVKVAGKKKIAGKAVGSVKRKRPRTNTHPVASTRSRPTSVKAAGNRISRGVKILNEIDKLEAKAKEVKNRDLKNLYYHEINALHRKLVNLRKSA